MKKRIGVQKELNEIAEALTVNGFDVTNVFETDEKLDVLIYYDDKSNIITGNSDINVENKINDSKVLKINAANTNIDEIMEKIKRL